MNEQQASQAKSPRVRAGGMVVIVLVALGSLGLCVFWVALLASETIVDHAMSRNAYGMASAYLAVFATAGASIALVFSLLVGKAGK